MKFPAILFIALLVAQSVEAATVEVEACAEFEVIEASSPGVIGSVPEVCTKISLVVEPDGDVVSQTQSDSRDTFFAYGGCNSTSQDVTFRAERRIRYSIVSNPEPFGDPSNPGSFGERVSARVSYSWLPDAFTSGSDSMSELINTGISSGTCFDSFNRFTVFAEASSGLDPFRLTNPAGVSGYFFDSENPGHGFNLFYHAAGLSAYYYGHTASGERLWLVSSPISVPLLYNTPMEFELFEVTDGGFGTPVLPETVWGTFSVTLNDCDSGSAFLDGVEGELGFSFTRLAGMENASCN